MKGLLSFLVTHSIFAGLCAAALSFESYLLLDVVPNYFLIVFIFLSTVASYNFYWLVGKYAFSPKKTFAKFLNTNRINVILIFVAGILATTILILRLYEFIQFVFVAVGLTLLYVLPMIFPSSQKSLRQLGFIKTVLLASTWTYTTMVLPLLSSEAELPYYLIAARFFFMFTLCILFDKKDMIVDKQHKLNSIATGLKSKMLPPIINISILLYGILYAIYLILHEHPLWILAVAIILTSLFIIHRKSYSQTGYLFYYVIVDGVMIWSAVIIFIFYSFF